MSDAEPASLESNSEGISQLPVPAIYVREVTLGTARRVLQAGNIDTSRPLVEYGLDSIRATELVVELEDIFHVQIPDEQTTYLITVDDIADYLIAELLHAQRIL
ncbi:acyl carrier protein [Mycobacteroides stephanolepidis]|uniref:acyl carrier protein n=1 Tax=[Mycobacterium] stephanolepidis TaxID=1520670 RepID=UPI001300A9FF